MGNLDDARVGHWQMAVPVLGTPKDWPQIPHARIPSQVLHPKSVDSTLAPADRLRRNQRIKMTTNPWNADKPYDISGMWLAASACQQHINKAISGNGLVGAAQYMVEKYLGNGPNSRLSTLVVGSNEGNMTVGLREFGYTGRITETDIAEKAMQRAAGRYSALGLGNITQVQADLNKMAIPGPFDVIIAEGVLHHIENIDFCLENLLKSLKPNGLLLAVEYIGPVRFQLSELNLQWINASLDAMPRQLRPFDKGVRPHFPPSTEDAARVYYVVGDENVIRALDPSEACIGEILDDRLRSKFEVLERKGFGGTLLSYMTGHFDFARSNTDPYAREWLKCLINLEQTVIKTGILSDHFCFYALRKP